MKTIRRNKDKDNNKNKKITRRNKDNKINKKNSRQQDR
jgi:hypothetical protein